MSSIIKGITDENLLATYEKQLEDKVDENLRDWFKEKWVRFGPDGKIRGDCARGDDSEGKPKCLPQKKAHSLGKKGRASAAARKRREDPNPERRGKAKNVATKKKTNESNNDAGYTKALADLQYLLGFIKSNPKMMSKDLKQMGPINPAQNILKKALEGCDYIEKILQNNPAIASTMKNLKRELISWYRDGNKPLSHLLNGTIGKINFPTNESKCPHCGGKMVSEELMNEKKDACYYKVKSRYKVWPSAYASGALVKCRKKGASNWGKSKTKESAISSGVHIAEQSDFNLMLKNITAQNPKGSAAEKILLGKFLGSDQGTYARTVIGKNHKGWIEHITSWLQKNKLKLQKEFNELDFSDLESLAYDMYENYLAKQGQLEEGNVVSMQARRTPLVVAGSPYDWDIYDLRTNKMVANILGGDRHDSPLYEIRIRSSGMTPTTRMLPTYVLRAGPNNNPPYKAYELVAPEGGFGKVEKSPGPGGTTKLRPDQDDMLRHLFKNLGGGKYYGYDLVLVEQGLDQYELIEKALGAKIMEIDDAMELGYTDWDQEDSSSIVYLGNKGINEFFDAGGGGDDDDELKRQVVEMYFEDGLRETEISRITGLSEVAVHKIIDAYEHGDFTIDEGQIYSTGGGPGQGYTWYRPQPAGLEEEKLDEKCWKTHKQVGMKKKGGRMVPNCIPKESAVMKGITKENIKVQPVTPVIKHQQTQTQPKQQTYTPNKDKKTPAAIIKISKKP